MRISSDISVYSPDGVLTTPDSIIALRDAVLCLQASMTDAGPVQTNGEVTQPVTAVTRRGEFRAQD